MKSKERKYNCEVFASEAAFKKRFRRLAGAELADHKKRLANAVGEKKSRITIYFDSDVIETFKQRAETEGVGYQTLMNRALRDAVKGDISKVEQESVKEDILSDKRFLRRLKTALSS